MLVFCFFGFFPQLKLEGGIFFHRVGEQPFGSEEQNHAASRLAILLTRRYWSQDETSLTARQ